MAEFKLGRIRFIWKGDWTASTVYWKDDVVRHGGNTYICTKGYTSTADFQDDIAGYWNKSSDGQEWKGDWIVATYYKINDIVKNGGYLYVANEGHTSAATAELGLENDQSKWDLFAEFFNYNADWAIATAYKINDIVKYGGTVYICITSHTSAATTVLGLEQDQAKWQIFSEGFNWKDNWTANYRYRVNDIVRDGGIMYVCITGHTSAATNALGLEADQAKWEYAHKGIDYRSDWATTTRYKVNDVVKHGGGIWICITYHTSQSNFTVDQAKWSQFVEGLEFEDSWDPGTSYQPGDLITYGGYSYAAITNNLEKRPSDNPTDWDLFTTGFRFRQDWGDDSTLEEYHVGDVVRLGGYTYLCIADSSGHRPPNATYWERLNSGLYWKNAHADATIYDAGDTVRQGVSSYICVLGHTSNTGVNDPANDGPGTYWNLLAGGPETDVLTTAGDLLYHSGAGAARLPIGDPGQVLSVTSAGNAPEWAAYGKIDNIFYADNNIGENEEAPGYGVTLSRPWKNLKYACDQIDRGALRPNAKKLLERNKGYIQAEVREYVKWNHTASNATGIWVGYTCDDLDKCARDEGYIIDALIHDISHGGNKSIRDATMTFFNGGHYPYAKRLITNNKQFIIDEVMSWFDITYPGVHTAERHAFCVRDTGYNIDAIIHDITHGGQDESVRVAKLYWTGASSKLGSGEIAYALAVNTQVRDLINNNILTNSGSYSRYQNRGKITTSGVHGRSAADLIEVDAITVSCPMGSKTYPLSTNATTAFTVLASGLTDTTFQVTLGTSAIAQTYVKGGVAIPGAGAQVNNRLDIRNFDYNTGTGIATITTMGGATVTATAHGKNQGDLIAVDSVLLSCSLGQKTYPVNSFSTAHSTNQTFEVLASGLTGTAFEIDLGTSAITHTYVSGGTVVKAGGARLAITNFVYNAGTGIATVTTATHSLSAAVDVEIRGVVMTCTHGTKVYPAIPHAGIYPITKVADADTLDFYLPSSAIAHTYVAGGTVKSATLTNVGGSTAITNFVYVNAQGLATITSTGHGLAVGNLVKIASVTLSCPTGNKVYPDTNVSSGVFYVYDVPDANTLVIGMDQSAIAHTYVSGGTCQKVTNATTDSVNISGFVFDAHSGHGLAAANTVNLFGIITNCEFGTKVYPQMPVSGIYNVKEAPTTSTLNVFLPPSDIEHNYTSGGTVKLATPTNVGGSTAITNFVYDNTTGYTTITSASHGLAIADYVKLATISVTCTLGGNSETIVYPDQSIMNDLSSGYFKVYDVPNANTFVIGLEKSNIVHTYVSGGTSQKVTIATSASVNVSDFLFAKGSSTQWFDVGDGEASAGNRVTYLTSVISDITQNGLGSVPTSLPLLTSINDEIDQTKAAADYGTTVIDAVLSNALPATSYQAKTSRGYLTTATHGRSAADLIEVRDIAVTCPQGSKTYPLVSNTTAFTVHSGGLTATQFRVTLGTSAIAQSYISGGTVVKAGGARLAITDFAYNTGGNHSVTAATYTPASGVMVLTIGTHNFQVGNYVNIAATSLTFTCALDSHATEHSYPRAGGDDPSYNTPVAITAIGTDSITINVGISSDTSAHTFVRATTNCISSIPAANSVSAATYDPGAGILVLTIGTHSYLVGNWIRIATDSLTFTCALNSHATQHTYPRAGGSDPAYNAPVLINAVDATTITVQVGISSDTSAHTFVSATDNCITNDIGTGIATITTATSHSLSASDTVNLFGIKTNCEFGIKIYPQMPFSGIYPVTEVPDTTHLNIFLPGSNVAHSYTSGGTVKLATPSNSGGSTAITGFVYDNTTGYTTVTSTSHALAIGDYVKLDAITVSCVYGNKVYPDTANSSGIFTVYDVPDANTYVVALDKGNVAHTYVSGGTSQKVTVATSASVNISGFVFDHTPAITQVIDTSLTEESDAQTLVTSLTGIMTTALGTTATPGTSTLVPAELIAGNTLFAKTGRFDETLPIIVPANTAIVGDELRSVRVYAAAATVTDSVKVLAGVNRLKLIINDIVQNTAITKTSGNAEAQVVTRPAGSTGGAEKAEGLVQELYDYIDWGVNGASVDSTVPQTTGSNFTVTNTGYTYAVEVLEANRTFIKAEIIAFITANYPAYTGYATKCERDLDFFLDGVQYDLVHNTGSSGVRPYEGNYKTLLYARYYVNSVSGNALEDMFYMRNATGLRNMSLNGLAGTLGSANSYGTSRPTAGAFISLDPGWGPDDDRTWIFNKSPYAQNVTNFGDGCIGLKVDGDIHNGGYDSIVANDFTQIINDGIGAWVTNLSRVELVSVFTYYCHIGYLAENGGKIRATNGNNSYGNFGSVAEYKDNEEIAITGTINNRSTEANINQVITNGDDILTFEFLNAGVNYTGPGTTITPLGDGFGAVIASSNIKNGAVYEVRLLDPASNLGGADYVTAGGKAQGGNLTSITISNTDTGTNTTYIGMNVFITSGIGAGQFGYIDTFNSTSKIATVRKHSDDNAGWDHVLGDDSSTYPTLDDTTTYIIEPRVTFTSPPSGHPWDDCAKGRAKVSDGKIEHIRIWDPGSGYVSAPTMTLTDPNNTVDAPNLVRIGNGVLTQPTWTNRGTDFETATATVSGDGYADMYQPGNYIRMAEMSDIPQDGANIEFGGIAATWFKLVQTTGLTGTPGTYTGLVQVSPTVSVTDAPEHGEAVTFSIRYSQVRLTGHDFLDIGTGDFTETNYPGTPTIPPDQTKETNDFGGGRCFYTATDQDGNFRVGELFNIEQSTGIATLNAEAFNISGLQSLQLGAVELGGTGAVISEFSTDGTFTANSDEIVPTQRAIKTYISSQIGGGAGELNVNSMVAGVVQINSNQITTTTGVAINIASSINFQAGVSGQPLAINYFLKA